MQGQVKKSSSGIRLRTQENVYLLNSLMTAIQSQAKNPLAEHKSNYVPTPRDSKLSKFSFNETGVSTYAPKSNTAVTLKSYLKKNLNHTTTEEAKPKTSITCKTNASNITDLTNGAYTQRGKTATKEPFSSESEGALKTFRLSHGIASTINKSAQSEYMSFSKAEKEKPKASLPCKNLSINPAADTSTDSLKANQLKCLTTRSTGLEPTDLSSNAPLQPAASISIPNYEPSKCSLKSNGAVKAYAANTNQGLVRYIYLFLIILIEDITKTEFPLY